MGLDRNGVTEPLINKDGECLYVVRVLDRRFPPPESMTEKDYEEMKLSVERRRMMERRYPQYYAPLKQAKEDPFSFENIAREYQLQYYVSPEDVEEAEEGTPEETSKSEPK